MKILEHALVRCPRCRQQARVDALPGRLRLACGACGYSASDDNHSSLSLYDYATWSRPAFDAELWLSATCCGGRTLWAVNAEHLELIAEFVAERESRSRTEREDRRARKLPGWIKDAKHRDEVLRTLSRLRRTL